jgi:hypothetical protein
MQSWWMYPEANLGPGKIKLLFPKEFSQQEHSTLTALGRVWLANISHTALKGRPAPFWENTIHGAAQSTDSQNPETGVNQKGAGSWFLV